MTKENLTELEIAGRFDIHCLDQFLTKTRGASAVVVDVSATEFIDNHALDALEDTSRRLGGALVLAGDSPVTRITLELTGRSLRLYPSVAAAKAVLLAKVAT